MRNIFGIGALLLAMVAGIGTAAAAPSAAPTPPPQAKGAIKTANGETIGTILLTQLQDGRVYISAEAKGLPPGDHGISLRRQGSCASNASAAGAAIEGLDLPKFTIRPDRMGTLEAFTDRITVTPSDKSVLDADGTAVVITAFGDENNKVACAALEPVPVPSPTGNNTTTRATAEFKTVFGETIGTATMTQNSDGSVRIQAQVRGLPPGEHAIHIHQFGQCAPVFGAAGEHHNPLNKTHGMESPDPMHPGDLPNINIGNDGRGTLDATTTAFTLTPSDTTIIDSDGSALIIHARPDDERSQPGGNADGRIACAVVQVAAAQTPGAGNTGTGNTGTGNTGTGTGAGNLPSQLPNTSGENTPWAGFILAALLLVVAGALLRNRLQPNR